MDREYISRIADGELNTKLSVFGAVHIVGPKWCGKTTTAEQHCKSALKLQKDPNKEGLIETARINPAVLLNGEKPRLIDEWQDAPNLWDAVRVYCDDNHARGQFVLTGSTSRKIITSHTGTGRISKLKMYPMSLYESKESNGTVSLSELFNNKDALKDGCVSDLTIDGLIAAACRGGWPESVIIGNTDSGIMIARDYYNQIYEEDMYHVDDVKRNKETMKALLRSYGRNLATISKNSSIMADVSATNSISDVTFADYLDVLERLFIIEDIHGWCPSIRSATAIRNGRKRMFVDPSIAVASQGASPEIYSLDLKTFGFVFECLCMRDLRIYSSSMDGSLSYYRDRYGLEADAVLHLADGRYALFEIKLGAHEIEEGAKHLNELERLISKYNEREKQCPLRKPDLKVIITGTKYGYKREDGVFVIPIGCLKD